MRAFAPYIRAAAAAWLVMFVAITPPSTPVNAGQARALESIIVVSTSGEHRFEVEIADTDATRARGLMFRRSLGSDRGMLFLYESEQPISMWMRNTYIPLDMVFIRADGRVHGIASNTEPFSEAVIASGGPVAAVLEIAAGGAARLGLKAGGMVRHSHFDNAP